MRRRTTAPDERRRPYSMMAPSPSPAPALAIDANVPALAGALIILLFYFNMVWCRLTTQPPDDDKPPAPTPASPNNDADTSPLALPNDDNDMVVITGKDFDVLDWFFIVLTFCLWCDRWNVTHVSQSCRVKFWAVWMTVQHHIYEMHRTTTEYYDMISV